MTSPSPASPSRPQPEPSPRAPLVGELARIAGGAVLAVVAAAVVVATSGCPRGGASADAAAAPRVAGDAGTTTRAEVGPTRAEVGPAGGEVTSAPLGIRIRVPAGALADSRTLTVALAASPPPLPLPEPQRAVVRWQRVYELGPDGTRFAAPVEVAVEVPPERLAAAAGEDVWVEAATFTDGVWRPLPVSPPDADGVVRVRAEHFSLVHVAVAGLAMAGVATYGLLEWADAWKNPHKGITPGAMPRSHLDGITLPAVIAPPVDLNRLGFRAFEPRAGRWHGWRPRVFPADGATMLSQGDANCWDTTNYVASVLLAKNDPRFADLRCVSGKMTNQKGDTGDHAWIELQIDGQLYVVDTSRPQALELLTRDDAYRRWKLAPSKQWTAASGSLQDYQPWSLPPDAGGGLALAVSASGQGGQAAAGGAASLTARVEPGARVPLTFVPWGPRRESCTTGVVEKAKRMKDVKLWSHGPQGCSFGTADGTLRSDWSVTEERIVWSGPGVPAGPGPSTVELTVPAEPGTFTVTAAATVTWRLERLTATGTTREEETESGTGTFTISVGAR